MSEAVLVVFAIIVIIGWPFIPILGANFILAAMGLATIPYTLGTWIGSLFLLIAFGFKYGR